jgi:hypothetical protein
MPNVEAATGPRVDTVDYRLQAGVGRGAESRTGRGSDRQGSEVARQERRSWANRRKPGRSGERKAVTSVRPRSEDRLRRVSTR